MQSGCVWVALGSAGIQKLVTLKALVLLDAGEGVIVDALKQVDLETWFSIKVLFSSSQNSTYTLTARDTRSDSLVTAVCPVAELSLAPRQGSLEIIHT